MRKTSLRCSDTPLLVEHFSPLEQKPEEKTISGQSSNLKSPKKYFTYGGGDAGGTWHWFNSPTPPQLSNSFFCKVFKKQLLDYRHVEFLRLHCRDRSWASRCSCDRSQRSAQSPSGATTSLTGSCTHTASCRTSLRYIQL